MFNSTCNPTKEALNFSSVNQAYLRMHVSSIPRRPQELLFLQPKATPPLVTSAPADGSGSGGGRWRRWRRRRWREAAAAAAGDGSGGRWGWPWSPGVGGAAVGDSTINIVLWTHAAARRRTPPPSPSTITSCAN